MMRLQSRSVNIDNTTRTQDIHIEAMRRVRPTVNCGWPVGRG